MSIPLTGSLSLAAPFERRPRGFSLLQLLLVVVLIGVLAALVLPVLGKVREESRQVGCVSNLRQMGVAFQAYAIEHNNRFPVVYEGADADASVRATWMAKLGPYLGLKKEDMGNPPYARAVGIFICPAFPAAETAKRNVGYRYSYPITTVWKYERMPLLMHRIFLVVEAPAANSESFRSTTRGDVERRHPGQAANFLVADGSVETFRTVIPATDPRWGETKPK